MFTAFNVVGDVDGGSLPFGNLERGAAAVVHGADGF